MSIITEKQEKTIANAKKLLKDAENYAKNNEGDLYQMTINTLQSYLSAVSGPGCTHNKIDDDRPTSAQTSIPE